jgi:SAM-dependent methyltransferase
MGGEERRVDARRQCAELVQRGSQVAHERAPNLLASLVVVAERLADHLKPLRVEQLPQPTTEQSVVVDQNDANGFRALVRACHWPSSAFVKPRSNPVPALCAMLLWLSRASARQAARTPSLGPAREGLKRVLDALGLVAFAYDLRARLGYVVDGSARAQNARFRASGVDDGLPLPPPTLVYSVAGHFSIEEYYESGRLHAELLRRVLADNGFELERFRSLLDFGCGCGRVLRHWRELTRTHVHGCDYNRRLVAWCRRSLPFAEFRVNHLAPPFPYGAGSLDFVYAISVFTHLTEELQHAWMRELERVLAPGGVVVVTTKGRSRLGPLADEERRRFDRGELVVQATRYAGRNLCAAYHPESYVRDRLAVGFNVLDFLPAVKGSSSTQDVLLLQRPE